MTFTHIRARAVGAALSVVAVALFSAGCGSGVAGPFPPASVSAVAGSTPQTATAGAAVATPPAVRVVDANGTPVQGVAVTFAVTAGGGSVAGASQTTNSSGIATSTGWTLGTTAGVNTLTATAGMIVPATFTATGVAGPPTQVAKTSADPQTGAAGTAVPVAPSVTLRDVNGNTVAGVPVTFAVTAGGGTIAGGTVSSNAAGVATSGAWTLGGVPGVNTVSATAAGLPSLTFTTTGVPGAPASIVVAPTTVTLGAGGTQQLTAVVSDQFGNVIAAPPVSYTSAATGVATVSTTGLVTAVSVGTATVTASSSTVSKAMSVVVVARPLGSTYSVITSLPGRPFGIGVSSANRVAVTQQDLNAITLLDVSGTGARFTVPVGRDPGDVVFNRSGSTAFVSGFDDGSIVRVNVVDGSSGGSVTVGGNAYRLALSPDETRLYVSSTSGTLSVVNPAVPSVVTSTMVGGSLQGLALGAGGQLYLSSTSGTISRLTASTLATNAANPLGGMPQDIAVTADGSEAVVANEAGWVDFLDGVTLVSRQRVPIASGRPFGLAITPDNSQVYVTATNPGRVIVLDRTTRAVVHVYNVGGAPRRVTFTTDGLTALIANEGGWIDVIK